MYRAIAAWPSRWPSHASMMSHQSSQPLPVASRVLSSGVSGSEAHVRRPTTGLGEEYAPGRDIAFSGLGHRRSDTALQCFLRGHVESFRALTRMTGDPRSLACTWAGMKSNCRRARKVPFALTNRLRGLRNEGSARRLAKLNVNRFSDCTEQQRCVLMAATGWLRPTSLPYRSSPSWGAATGRAPRPGSPTGDSTLPLPR